MGAYEEGTSCPICGEGWPPGQQAQDIEDRWAKLKAIQGQGTLAERLRLAVDPYGDHTEEDVDTLLWRAGQMHREIEAAHNWLDMRAAPLSQSGDVLTLRGRMDAL